MVKITHIFKTYFPETNGGLEEAIRQMGRHSVKDGYDVEVIATGKRDVECLTADGIKVKFYKKELDFYSNPFSLSLVKNFKTICENTDIVHFHFTWPTVELLALFYRIKKPMVVTFHCDIHKNRFLKTIYLPVIRRFLKQADKICVTSENLFRTTSYLHEFQDKVEKIYLWFDESRFLDLPQPDISVANFIQKVDSYALFAGVLRWYKGLDILLDASKNVGGEIVIVGNGPLYSHLKARIRKEKLCNVHLLGFQSDSNLKLLIQGSRFIVLPSMTGAEAFGQILIEGLYFSKPLISTELGTGTSLVNQHNHTGYVVQPGCCHSLADAMNKMFKNQYRYDHLKANTFHHYKKHFTEAVQGDKYSRIYRSVLAK